MRISNPIVKTGLPVIAGKRILIPQYRRIKVLCDVEVAYYDAPVGLRNYKYRLRATHRIFEVDGEMMSACVVQNTSAVAHALNCISRTYDVKVTFAQVLSRLSVNLIRNGINHNGKSVQYA